MAGPLASVIVVCLLASGAAADTGRSPRPEARQRKLLVIETETDRPGFIEIMEGLREVVVRSAVEPRGIWIEDLHFGLEGPRLERTVAWLKAKYAGTSVDALVTTAFVPFEYVRAIRDQVFPGVPVVMAGITKEQAAAAPFFTGLSFELDYGSYQAAIRSLFPGTRRIYVVGGLTYGDVLGEVATARLRLATRLEVTPLAGLTLAELEQRVARLPEDSILLYVNFHRDRERTFLIPRDVLERLAARSNRPVFGIGDTCMGHGVVCAGLIDYRILGRQTGEIVQRVLREPTLPAVETGRLAPLQVDHRQLVRWKVPLRRVPPGGEVLFAPPSLWEAHRGTVLATGSALAALLALVAFLLAERRRRYGVEQRLRRLSRSMLRSQEQERGRISRDLHDDVNQRVALAAIELDGIARAAGTENAQGPRVRAVADELRSIGHSLHVIAQGLRPSEIEAGGLLSALRSLAAQVAARSSLSVEVDGTGWHPDAPTEVGIVFYRVAQEGLQNALKHGRGTRAALTVAATPSYATLCLSDDGLGFDTGAPVPLDRLGLTGLRERLRMVGGSLSIESAPGAGTLLRAEIPLPVVPAEGPGEKADGEP